ncbi:acylneuraminate cytidylyltransferase [Lucifera butyrica]|uniref:Acylneuraminate cytidylyltransferase n=1 Tax=Lucifera butyrica TaxID=1351585 RepID=A0A498R2B0_9FIRM|nr:acylneuraminate cytidylyltransferase family protein [Lucifera butyrica]VBB05531.1 acylneuraminate cytidylyltransferase [Lucifera butyrica]
MIENKSVLAIIPARGGSKEIPRKNIAAVGGKPLIVWTIEAAQKSKYIDRLILSSDDDEIMTAARKWGCEVPFKRPPELARDDTPGIEPVLHALTSLPGYDYVVLLQPTSPLRSPEDIDGCIELCVGHRANACVTVTEPDKSPYWMFYTDKQGFLQPVLPMDTIASRRQDLPSVYALNGAVYVAHTSWLLKKKSFLTAETLAYKMPKKRSIDIDTETDLLFVSFLLAQK